jgi:hypothetical protein
MKASCVFIYQQIYTSNVKEIRMYVENDRKTIYKLGNHINSRNGSNVNVFDMVVCQVSDHWSVLRLINSMLYSTDIKFSDDRGWIYLSNKYKKIGDILALKNEITFRIPDKKIETYEYTNFESELRISLKLFARSYICTYCNKVVNFTIWLLKMISNNITYIPIEIMQIILNYCWLPVRIREK